MYQSAQRRHSSASRSSVRIARHSDRRGMLITTELIFVFPVMLILTLVAVQMILVHATYARVQAAAIAAADLAARGGDIDAVHDQAAMVMGYLGANHETKMEYVDTDASSTLQQDIDFVAVGIKLPMGLVTTNYLGLLGGSLNDLQIRSVVCKYLETDIP